MVYLVNLDFSFVLEVLVSSITDKSLSSFTKYHPNILKMKSCLFYLTLLALLFLSCNTQKRFQDPMTDQEFFANLNLDHQGLESVRTAVQKNDFYTARNAYLKFLKIRNYPQSHHPSVLAETYPSTKRKSAKSSAEQVLQNTFSHENVTYRFPKKIDWHFNPTDSKQNRKYKGSYKREWTVLFNRMKSTRLLANAFEDTGNPIYAKKIDELIRDWIHDCPPVVPQNDAEIWRSSWRSLEAGIRTGIEWPVAWLKTIKSNEIKDTTLMDWVKSWMEHGEYLETYQGRLNWATTESKGLFTIGVMFPEFRQSKSWRALALDRVKQQLENDFYPDGAHVELSPEYHWIASIAISEVYTLAKIYDYPVDKDLIKRLKKSFDYLIDISLPNRYLPRVNDAGNNKGLKAIFKKSAGLLFPDDLTYQWFISNGKKGRAPEEISVRSPWAGQVAMREHWQEDANFLFMEYGPYGAGSHQHEDKLGVHIAIEGDLFVFEAGRENYGKTALRDYCLSSQAHSVITIDGLSQNREKVRPSLNKAKQPYPVLWNSQKMFDYACANYGEEKWERYGDRDKSLNLGTWKRHSIYVKPDLFVIVDLLIPNDRKKHTYQSHFHINAEKVKLNSGTQQLSIKEEGRPSFNITPLQVEDMTAEVIKGQMSPEILGWELFEGKEDRAIPTLRFEQRKSGPVAFAYLFQGNQDMEAKAPVNISQIVTPKDLFGLNIEENGKSFSLIFRVDGNSQIGIKWEEKIYQSNALIQYGQKEAFSLEKSQ